VRIVVYRLYMTEESCIYNAAVEVDVRCWIEVL
jgi:hypothetical protein